MSSLGKFIGAAVQNENTVAPINSDFTLLKVEVPVEYTALGSTISRKRKNDAEEGPLHKTARKLGALFKGMLPNTDDFIQSLREEGLEISSISGINPHGSLESGGIFANHIGADTASIWAAATSGSGAIAWIHKRQEEILYSQEQESQVIAAKQEISRADLGNWDASVRAWLQSADQAKARQHKQTMLIINNASVSVNSEPETYSSVMKAWIAALEAMNNLVKGVPQRVQDGAALLAISSWHLYPDMAVYGESCVQVTQNDPTFRGGALLTLGLQDMREDTKGVFWSLPLACLQYYGHQVQASRSVGQDNSRVSSEQFMFIAMGCLFDSWNLYAKTNEEGFEWIERISKLIERSARFESHCELKEPSWLSYLLEAARSIEKLDDMERKIAKQLLNLGRRRFLRQLALHLCLDPGQFIIRYKSSSDELETECASLAPVQWIPPSSKRTRDGDFRERSSSPPRHVRWIYLSVQEIKICMRRIEDFCNLPQCQAKLRNLESVNDPDTWKDFSNPNDTAILRIQFRANDIRELKFILKIGQRRQAIEEQDELCLPTVAISDISLLRGVGDSFVKSVADLDRKLLSLHIGGATARTISPVFFAGDDSLSAICATIQGKTQGKISSRCYNEGPPSMPVFDLSPDFLEDVISKREFSHSKIQLHLYSSPQELIEEETDCLKACAKMIEIYKLLPGATISTLVLDTPLSKAKWFPIFQEYSGSTFSASLTRPQAFACIAMFESGTCNVDPHSLSEVFVISSGNSLFVTATLLCDPFEQPACTEIRRVVGNVGSAGITFLIAPPEVNVRDADSTKWMFMNDNPFNGAMEDHFKQTSIHISFTQYEVPVISDNSHRHIIDRAVVLVETLVSVYDGGEWVAELDILKAFRSTIHRPICDVSQHPSGSMGDHQELPGNSHPAATSVENWNELIEAPSTGTIAVRAHKN
ncbi:hypothetical protein G7Y89_g614 [Cudoniella acicularis]|uniref:Uncharacterized protein n=1 Tax=Cudoniella acicularis TaxID=354080 RepID=A0A8H4WB15_9HELO|nr:hypothetical protein G7Y89_g614 [Cudoniella acicularis]